MHPVCNKALKYNCKKCGKGNSLHVLNTNVVWGKSNASLSTTLDIFKHSGDCIMLWVCFSSVRPREYFRIKINGIELNTGKILEENLVHSAFQQTLGDKFTFQQDNNIKHKTKYKLELLTKMTLNVSECPSYSFELKSPRKYMARLENLYWV